MRRAPSASLLRKIDSVRIDQQFTSSITVGELIYGAFRNSARADELLDQIEGRIMRDLTVLPFDTVAAKMYGELRATLERDGTPIGDADARIAAIALVNNLTVVTGNVRHFQRVPGLLVENWL